MKALLILALCLIAQSVSADKPDPKQDPDNYCYQQKAWSDLDKLHQDAPNDNLVVRMYAMRKGICALIEEGKITRERGTEIFDLERSRTIIERQQDEARNRRNVGA